jgi:hypothetical protein
MNRAYARDNDWIPPHWREMHRDLAMRQGRVRADKTIERLIRGLPAQHRGDLKIPKMHSRDFDFVYVQRQREIP